VCVFVRTCVRLPAFPYVPVSVCPSLPPCVYFLSVLCICVCVAYVLGVCLSTLVRIGPINAYVPVHMHESEYICLRVFMHATTLIVDQLRT